MAIFVMQSQNKSKRISVVMQLSNKYLVNLCVPKLVIQPNREGPAGFLDSLNLSYIVSKMAKHNLKILSC